MGLPSEIFVASAIDFSNPKSVLCWLFEVWLPPNQNRKQSLRENPVILFASAFFLEVAFSRSETYLLLEELLLRVYFLH